MSGDDDLELSRGDDYPLDLAGDTYDVGLDLTPDDDPAVDVVTPEVDELLAETCPDGATCHLDCGDECWRVEHTAPLSGVFPDDRWPDDVLEPQRSAFLKALHELGLDALVLDDLDARPGVLVSQDQLLAILGLLDPEALEHAADRAYLVGKVVACRTLAREWDARAVEIYDDTPDKLAARAVADALTSCAIAIYSATDGSAES